MAQHSLFHRYAKTEHNANRVGVGSYANGPGQRRIILIQPVQSYISVLRQTNVDRFDGRSLFGVDGTQTRPVPVVLWLKPLIRAERESSRLLRVIPRKIA
jgi:hypothetical protein